MFATGFHQVSFARQFGCTSGGTPSFSDVEDLMAERGIDVRYETFPCWQRKFSQLFAHNLRKSRTEPTSCWHLDEMVAPIGGERMYL
jgi:putative transposase